MSDTAPATNVAPAKPDLTPPVPSVISFKMMVSVGAALVLANGLSAVSDRMVAGDHLTPEQWGGLAIKGFIAMCLGLVAFVNGTYKEYRQQQAAQNLVNPKATGAGDVNAGEQHPKE